MNFDKDKNYADVHQLKNRAIETIQEGIQYEYEDIEEDFSDSYGEGTEQEIEMKSDLEFHDSKALDNMVADLANFNKKFANMSIKQKTSYFVSDLSFLNSLDY